MARKFLSNNLIEAKVDFPFILFQLGYSGKVTYIRPDIPDKKNVLSEDDFVKYIQEYWPVTFIDDFEDHYNQYLTIILKRDGSWTIYETPKDQFTFDQISDYNKKLDEKEKLEQQPVVERTKPHMESIFDQQKNERQNRLGIN